MLIFVPSATRWLISSFWRFVKILLQALGSATRAICKSVARKKDLWPNLVSILFHSKPFVITWKVYMGPFVKPLKKLQSYLKPTSGCSCCWEFLFCITTLIFILGATSQWNVEFHPKNKIMFMHKFWMLTLTYRGVQSCRYLDIVGDMNVEHALVESWEKKHEFERKS
jgi:hypothetical protein